jgi:murein DD-endopeptidase MepM/ murein hydrolase activator NlpD
VLVSFFVFGTFLVFNEFINPDSEVKALKKTNSLLREKFDNLFEEYKKLDIRITELNDKSHDLRLKTNLEPNQDSQTYGTGGSIFEPIKVSSAGNLNSVLSDLEEYVNKVSLKVKLEVNNYEEIEKTFYQNELMYDAIPAIRPSEGHIADDYGMRKHPILKMVRMHNGIDIITDSGTKVYAPGNGKVEFVGRRTGYGITIEINHGFGYKTLYAHLSKAIVTEGQTVKRGDFIAVTGNSGELSSGPHLHYEVQHEGRSVNPINFIYDDLKLFEIVKK